MKNLLHIFILLISFSSFGQIRTISILEGGQLEEKFSNGIVGYFDINGNLLFEGKASERNIGDFKNHIDFKNISYYQWLAFEGDLLGSDSVNIQYYCDTNGNPTSIKYIAFKGYDEFQDKPFWVGTRIEYSRNGSIKKIEHAGDELEILIPGQKDLEKYVERMEIKFQERHKQVLQDRKNYMLYGELWPRTSSDICSSYELDEEGELFNYMVQVKKMSWNQALLYRNCELMSLTEEGNMKIVDAFWFIEEAISNDKNSINEIFPHTIKDFGMFATFTSDQFTYEMFEGFVNGGVRMILPDGVETPLTQEELSEYFQVIQQILEQHFFVENVDYYYIPLNFEDRFIYKELWGEYDEEFLVEEEFAGEGDTEAVGETYNHLKDYEFSKDGAILKFTNGTIKEFTFEEALNGEIQVWLDENDNN